MSCFRASAGFLHVLPKELVEGEWQEASSRGV